MIGALKGQQFIAPCLFNGHCDAALFEAYMEQCLLPELTPGSVIIADNAAFHKSSTVRRLIEAKQCQLLFLPPYSPDLNPIEHCWFPIKNKIRQLLDQGESLAIAAEQVLREMSEPIC
jgi:transposase